MEKLCLLCGQEILRMPSWQSLFLIKNDKKICGSCSNLFKRAEIKDKGNLLDQVTSLYVYDEAMKNYLHQFKFLQDIALAEVFKDDLRSILKERRNIVPIPMHAEKKKERTFAHVEALLKSARIPYIDVLEKKHTETMGRKTKEERLRVDSLFTCKRIQIIKPETYILVDDIYTTGTTLRHAAKTLKEAGAKRVEAVTLIRSI